jgi:hypothetical protein
VHDCTVVGPLTTISGGQVVVVQPFPTFAPEATHELTATFVVLLFEQVISVQALPAAAVCGVQIDTGRFVTTKGAGQVVSVQKLAAVGPDTVQVWTGTFVVVRSGQIVAMNRGPVAATGVQVPTSTGVSAELLVPQVVVVQPLPTVGPLATHARIGTFRLLLVVQAVAVQRLPTAAAAFTQEKTGVGPVFVTGQVVVVQAFVPSPVAGVHEAASIGVGPVVTTGQVVVV